MYKIRAHQMDVGVFGGILIQSGGIVKRFAIIITNRLGWPHRGCQNQTKLTMKDMKGMKFFMLHSSWSSCPSWLTIFLPKM